jgi:hypothetical protein
MFEQHSHHSHRGPFTVGHANLSNLSHFFVRRLYAVGKLSIHQAALAAQKAGQDLQASEGAYDDEGMLSTGFLCVVHYLTCADPTQFDYSGPQGGGPWLVPALTAWYGKRKQVTRLTAQMLDELEKGAADDLTLHGAVDRLLEEGHPAWAEEVRLLVRRRTLFKQWHQYDADSWDWNGADPYSDGSLFMNLPFQFAPGWRPRYREIPILSNITT